MVKRARDGPNAHAIAMGSADSSIIFHRKHPDLRVSLVSPNGYQTTGGSYGGSLLHADYERNYRVFKSLYTNNKASFRELNQYLY